MRRGRLIAAAPAAPVALVALMALVALSVTLVALSVAGAAGTGHPGAAAAAPDCTPGGLVLSQQANGYVRACVRLGDVAAGPHVVSLQDLLAYGPPPRRALPPGIRKRVNPTPPPAEPAVALTLSPASGGPGTVVTVTGRVAKSFQRGEGHPNLCWDGCQNGLSYGDVALRWTSARTFRTTITVPAAPWIEGGPPRVAPLVTGDYAIAIQCLRSARACSLATEGAATFHLHVTHAVSWCRTQATCARLTVTPARALPGEAVRVSGFAPLAAGQTPNAGSPYQLLVTRRRPHTPQFRFAADNGVRYATAGLGLVDLKAPPSYADSRPAAPVAELSDAMPQLAANPADPAEVAWCNGQTIALEGPGGTTAISTATVTGALRAMGFSPRYGPQPSCAAVAPLATVTGAPAGLAAAFSVTTKLGPPPSFLAGLVTRDNGQTWTPIPVPSASAPYGLAGFRYAGTALDAVFAVKVKKAPPAYPELDPVRTVTEVSSPDGQSWSEAPPGCPPAGSCVTFGPYQPGNCAMNGTTQALLRSTDGGRRWFALDFPYPVQACDQAQLVSLSPTSELLVDSASTYPVLRTRDGGRTWHVLGVPRRGGEGSLSVLPDGSLLMADSLGYRGSWKLLARGRGAWCALREPAAVGTHSYLVAPPTVIGARLWWLTGAQDGSAAPSVHQLPLSALTC